MTTTTTTEYSHQYRALFFTFDNKLAKPLSHTIVILINQITRYIQFFLDLLEEDFTVIDKMIS